MNNCIIFERFKDGFGYGRVSINGKTWMAHRWAYTQAYGDIPKGMVVRHLCHNPACINPDHLALGTYQDNSDDMTKANRQARGEGIASAKLSEAQAREIFALKPDGRAPNGFTGDLANRYGVDPTTIQHIWAKQKWKHIH